MWVLCENSNFAQAAMLKNNLSPSTLSGAKFRETSLKIKNGTIATAMHMSVVRKLNVWAHLGPSSFEVVCGGTDLNESAGLVLRMKVWVIVWVTAVGLNMIALGHVH